MTKKWLQLIALSGCVASGGCVYETFQEPTFIGTANVMTQDAGSDANSVDMSVPDDTGGDDGGTGDADMAVPPEPWQCPAIEMDELAISGSKVQVEALGDGWLIGWLNDTQALELRVLDASGQQTGSRTIFKAFKASRGAFDLLTAPIQNGVAETSFYVGGVLETGEANLYNCEGECSPLEEDLFINREAQRVSGFWRGGEQAPYLAVHGIEGANSSVVVFVYTNAQKVSVMNTNETDIRHLSLAAGTQPADPMLTTATHLALVKERAIAMASRPTSGSPIVQPTRMCDFSSSNVRKTKTIYEEPNLVFADVVDGESRTTLARIDCQQNNTSADDITGPLEELRDWDLFVANGYTRSFYAIGNILATRRFDNAIRDENIIANGNFEKVSVASAGARIGIGTIKNDGTVEFRTMQADGSCN